MEKKGHFKATRRWLALSAAALMALAPAPVRGQGAMVTFDATNFAINMKDFIEKSFRFTQEMENMINQLETQKANLETLRKATRIVSSFYQGAGVLTDLYDTYELLSYDIDRVQRQVTRLRTNEWRRADGSYNVVYPVESTVRLVDELAGRAYDTYRFTKDEVLKEDNSITLDKRLDLMREGLREMRGYHSALRDIETHLKKQNDAAATRRESGDYARKRATARLMGYDLSANERKVMDRALGTAVEQLSAPASRGAEDKARADAERERRHQSLGSLSRFAMYGVTVLFIILIGWGYGVFNHGDRQRSDVLFKIYGGYIVMMALISVFNAVFRSLF